VKKVTPIKRDTPICCLLTCILHVVTFFKIRLLRGAPGGENNSIQSSYGTDIVLTFYKRSVDTFPLSATAFELVAIFPRFYMCDVI
jgi:hypothetical protein